MNIWILLCTGRQAGIGPYPDKLLGLCVFSFCYNSVITNLSGDVEHTNYQVSSWFDPVEGRTQISRSRDKHTIKKLNFGP